MAEFLASHGQHKKALEIYRALVETLTRKDGNSRKESASGLKDQPPERVFQSSFSITHYATTEPIVLGFVGLTMFNQEQTEKFFIRL